MKKATRCLRTLAFVVVFAVAFSFAPIAWAAETTTVTISKVDAADSTKMLAGATFTLSGTSDAGEEVSKTLTTDENGVVVFDGIPGGEYTVTETTPPEGYKLPTEASKKVKIETKVTTYTVTIGFSNTFTEEIPAVDPGMGMSGGTCTCTLDGNYATGTGTNTCSCWDSGVHDDLNCSCLSGGGGFPMPEPIWHEDPRWSIISAVDSDGNTLSGVTATNGPKSLTFNGDLVSDATTTGEKTVTVSYNDLTFSSVSDSIPSFQNYTSTKTSTATKVDAQPATLTFTNEVKPPALIDPVTPDPEPDPAPEPKLDPEPDPGPEPKTEASKDKASEKPAAPAPATVPAAKPSVTPRTADESPVAVLSGVVLLSLLLAVGASRKVRS